MKFTGRYSPVEDPFDIDFKITEEVEIAQKIIARLNSELGAWNFNTVLEILAQEYKNAIGKSTR